jgi:hypothetical protein
MVKRSFKTPTKDDLLMDMVKTNRRTPGETMTSLEYTEHGEYDRHHATRRYGSWEEAKAAAGIYKYGDQYQISEQALLADIKRVDSEVDGKVTVDDYREHGEHHLRTYYHRFDGFAEARDRALD